MAQPVVRGLPIAQRHHLVKRRLGVAQLRSGNLGAPLELAKDCLTIKHE
jgi:hypothetical protein